MSAGDAAGDDRRSPSGEVPCQYRPHMPAAFRGRSGFRAFMPAEPKAFRSMRRSSTGRAGEPPTGSLPSRYGIVAKQIGAGIGVRNNGEQQREGLFLCVQHRMSGFGGSWGRPGRRGEMRCPELARRLRQSAAARRDEAVSNMHPPMNVGPVRYWTPPPSPTSARPSGRPWIRRKAGSRDPS